MPGASALRGFGMLLMGLGVLWIIGEAISSSHMRRSAQTHTPVPRISELPSNAPRARSSSPPGVISFGKPSYKDIMGPMNAIKNSFIMGPRQKSGKVVIAPVDNWSDLVYLPHDGGSTHLEIPDGTKISILWNGEIAEEFPLPEGIKSKMPSTVHFFQLKSNELQAASVKVTFR